MPVPVMKSHFLILPLCLFLGSAAKKKSVGPRYQGYFGPKDRNMDQRQTCIITDVGIDFIGDEPSFPKCNEWAAISAKTLNIKMFFLGPLELNKNWCRNPSFQSPGPGCLTNSGFINCEIKKCDVLTKHRSSYIGTEYQGNSALITGCGESCRIYNRK